MKTLFYKFFIGILLMLQANSYFSRAQCPAPTSIGTPLVTHASCPGNGQIVVNNMTPSASSLPAGDYYQYALYDTLGNVVAPWQASETLANVQAGEYDIWVRRVCTSPSGFSSHSTRRVTVNNTEVPPTINSITLQRQDHGCSNGRFQVSASGSAPLSYALVASLSEPEPPGAYVRAPQSSNIFDSLAAGTYYVRVYNACNNAVTQAFTVPAYNTPVTLSTDAFGPLGCDSGMFNFRINRHFQVANTSDTNTRAWVTWPNGQTDSVKLNNTTSTGLLTTVTVSSHISSIDPAHNPAESFWENLANYPYSIQYGYRDLCGNIVTGTYTLQQPQQREIQETYSTIGQTCDSVNATFRIRYTRTAPSQTLYHSYRAMHNVQYSLDTGATWQNAQTSNSLVSASNGTTSVSFKTARSQPVLLMVAICGDTLSKVINPPTQPSLTSNVVATHNYTCLGKSGLYINKGNAVGDSLGVEMLTAPAGQPLVPYFVTSGNNTYQPELNNLEPGTYTFRIYDTIGVECPRTREVSRTLTPYNLTYDYRQECSGALSVFETTSPQITSSSSFRLKIYDAQGNQVLGGTNGYMGSSSNPNTITVPSSDVASLADGTYTLRAYKRYSNSATYAYMDSCTAVDTTWVKGGNNLDLTPSHFVPGCPGNSGTIVAVAKGGTKPYTYQLTDQSNNTIAPSQPGGNIYNNLSTTMTYNLQVIDSCGTIVNRTMSIEDDLPIFANTGTMPCPGDDVTLFVDSMPGVSYQWYKDGVLLAGDTTHKLLIDNIQNPADSGSYTAQVVMGSCTVMTDNFVLNPNDCGTPLSVQLVAFSAYASGLQAKLEWTTNSEQHNKGFEVERSQDSRNWLRIGFVDSKAEAGNSISLLAYGYTDATPPQGNNFYRLKQLDINGSFTYSSIRKVAIGKATDLQIHPNPTTDRIEIGNLQEGDRIRIIATTGAIVRQQVATGATEIIMLDGLSNGLYQVKVVSADGHVRTGKVLKIK